MRTVKITLIVMICFFGYSANTPEQQVPKNFKELDKKLNLLDSKALELKEKLELKINNNEFEIINTTSSSSDI